MTVNHGIDRIRVTFDDESLVADAGLLLVATVAARLGLEALINSTVRLAGRVGGARPGRKALTLIHAMISGADCIDDTNRLRAGATGAVLGHRVMAPSTLGTFLRSFTFGHVRQLEAAVGKAIERAWGAGAGPTATLIVDVDSTICEVHGYAKAGAAYGYTKVLGYHPLLATRADTGEVLHARLRKGSANTARGIIRFIDELLARVERAGGGDAIIVRADSGFYQHKLLDRLSRAGVGFSVTIAQRQAVRAAIEAIPESAWQRIDYPDGEAHVAECLYRNRRLIVRRVPGHQGPQRQLFTTWRYHAFVTNLAGPAWSLDRQHRAHAVVELSIRDLKAGGLAHLPSGSFNANSAWLQHAVLAHNLIRWTAQLGGHTTDQLTVAKTFRTRLLNMPGRLVNRSGKPTLRLPARWPWADQFTSVLDTLRALPTVPL
ncbi:MAG: IS1380 family transposase [Microthrixaceae bacterium]|nr:IS1380 family transposase [Microthrixaceae bacterium]